MKRPNAYATANGSEKRSVEAKSIWVLLLIGSHSDIPWTSPRRTGVELIHSTDQPFATSQASTPGRPGPVLRPLEPDVAPAQGCVPIAWVTASFHSIPTTHLLRTRNREKNGIWRIRLARSGSPTRRWLRCRKRTGRCLNHDTTTTRIVN